MAEAQQLGIAAAERHYLDALHLAERHVGPNSGAAALPASLFARIRYDQGRLDEAEALLIDRVPGSVAGESSEPEAAHETVAGEDLAAPLDAGHGAAG